MRAAIRTLAALACFVLAGCGGGGDDGPTGNNGNNVSGDGNVTMIVNGTAWRSLRASDNVTKGSNNFIGISAFNPPYTLILGIGNVTGTGTRNLNLAQGGDGSSAIVSTTANGWGTAFPGGSGTITITTFTATRIAGTFSFDAVPSSGTAAALQVRNGTFDLTY